MHGIEFFLFLNFVVLPLLFNWSSSKEMILKCGMRLLLIIRSLTFTIHWYISFLLLVLILMDIGQLILSRINKARWYLTLTFELARLFNSFPYFSLADFCYNVVYSKRIFTVVTNTRIFAPQWRLTTRTFFFEIHRSLLISLLSRPLAQQKKYRHFGTVKKLTFLVGIQG